MAYFQISMSSLNHSTNTSNKNMSVSSFLLFRLPSPTVTEVPPSLHQYFSNDDPHHENSNPVLKGKTAAIVRESFVRQFERYVKGQYPFDTPLEDGQNTLSYWTHLTNISEGSVLACRAEKLYSIKPSSIPEERTMSVFTKMNTPARNRQQVRTLVDMTQIRQWHMYDPEKFAERRRPDVAFCDIESLISAPMKSPVDQKERHGSKGSYLSVDTADGEEEMLDEECTWLDNYSKTIIAMASQDSVRRHERIEKAARYGETMREAMREGARMTM
ncbi:hypothetical protein P692DRAFT_20820201 [Suillus brevipes Sb2]|nr:hypothetical protein P692DRAFT_20820201 [Suillus brevipes Sb2]